MTPSRRGERETFMQKAELTPLQRFTRSWNQRATEDWNRFATWGRTATNFLDRMAANYWQKNPLARASASLPQRSALQEFYRTSAAQPMPGEVVPPGPQFTGSNPRASHMAETMRQRRKQIFEPYIGGELPYEQPQYPDYGAGYGAGYGGYSYPAYGGFGGGGFGDYEEKDWGQQVEQAGRTYGEGQQLTLWNI